MKIYDINKEELIDYYINQKHSIKECAEYFNSDYTHICTVLKGYGIKKNKSITNKKITIFGTIKSIIVPILLLIVTWILILVGWYVIGLPLGIGTSLTM